MKLTQLKSMKRLLYPILFILSGSLHGQQQAMVRGSDGVNRLMIQKDGHIISIVPFSSIETITTNENPEGASNSVRDLTWEFQFSASGKVFHDISFANTQVGYIATELGGVYKSTDGGENWSSVLNLGFPYYWYGVHALTPDTVIISGFNNSAPINQGVIRWSFDGGSSWSSDINLGIPISGVGWLERVHFFNRDTGIIINSFSGGCWYTSTGGKDSALWSYITINPDMAWTAGNIDAQPSGNVYATGVHFASSTDYGTSWSSINSADSIFDGGVDFLDANNLYGWTGGGQISAPVAGWVHRTTDGGQTWSSRLNTFSYPIRALLFQSDTSGFAVGGNLFDEAGGIYSTTDGGLNWNLDENTSAEMFSIESKSSGDSTYFWCVGSTGGGTGFTGKIYRAISTKLATGVHVVNAETLNAMELFQNDPNPFTGVTQISFRIPVASYASLKVYDVLGNEVALLLDAFETGGYKSIQFDASRLSPGIYYYCLQTGNSIKTKKLMIQ